MASSVITFSDADMVRRLYALQAPGESVSLTAKRLLNDALDAQERTGKPKPVSIDSALDQVEKLGQLLRQLR